MFDKILTPANLKPSRSAYGYQMKLLGEFLRGKPDETFQSEWMNRGHEVEQEAREAYTLLTGSDVTTAGFCLEDGGRYGCSPDGLVEGGSLQVKCPSPGVHVGYLLSGGIPTTYRLQHLGELLVTGHEWIDFMSYHPDLDSLIVRLYRSEIKDELEILHNALVAFHDVMETRKRELIGKGHRPIEREAA
jgi:exodeoxyribonuclease (lambda-induced)